MTVSPPARTSRSCFRAFHSTRTRILLHSLVCLGALLTAGIPAWATKIPNPRILPAPTDRTQAQGYQIEGDVRYGELGDPSREYSGWGVRFLSASKNAPDAAPTYGSVRTVVTQIRALNHRWFRFQIQGLAQAGFDVARDDLYLQVEFAGSSPGDSLDKIKHRIYPQVRQERTDLADPSTSDKLGPATWRSYAMEFRTPFAEVDTLTLSIGFTGGRGTGEQAEFWVNEAQLTPIAPPGHFRARTTQISQQALQNLMPIGGRWYYDPTGLPRQLPKIFNHTNANRLLYLAEHLEAPFADNLSATLRDGYYDLQGRLVKRPRSLPNNVVITFTDQHLILQSHNIPNHPTAFFPDIWRAMDGNPNRVQEMISTWHLPFNPQPNPNRVAMTKSNANGALPGGPIGVAVNGVVFFNPYDLDRNEDAIWRLDRCCGHPAPNSQYHYHKYPVCIKSPWTDDGQQHSPLIGFAFDGFPVYGPYEAKGVLAKNAQANPLNDFNVHHDEARGWHYHVTPGAFPHILGGYFGTVDPQNRRGRGRPPREGRGRPRRRPGR